MPGTITPDELIGLKRSGRIIDLIDVRTPGEYESVHAEGARLVPLATLDPARVWGERQGGPDDPLYIICQSGGRSAKACSQFEAAGLGPVVNVTGGTLAWEAAGLPVVRGGSKVLPLDRQVRIVIGGFIAVCGALGALVNPVFAWLAAAGGAGLVFAGVTNICPLAMTLSRMPWNQTRTTSNLESSSCAVTPTTS